MLKPLQQNDDKFKNLPYDIVKNGDGTVKTNGCALMACANAYLAITGDQVDVKNLTGLSLANDCLNKFNQTKWRFLFVFAEHYGLNVEITHDISRALDAAGGGRTSIIVSTHNQNKKIFTKTGHWLTLCGRDDDKFLILDSNFFRDNYNSPESIDAMNKSLLARDAGKMQMWADAKLLASEIWHEFPEPKECEKWRNCGFGGAILTKKKSK